METKKQEEKARKWFIFYAILNIVAVFFLGIFIYVTRDILGDFSLSLKNSNSFFAIIYMVVSFGLLKRKKWLPNLLLVVVSLTAYAKLQSILLFSSMPLFIDVTFIMKYILLSSAPLLIGIFFSWYAFKYKNLFSN